MREMLHVTAAHRRRGARRGGRPHHRRALLRARPTASWSATWRPRPPAAGRSRRCARATRSSSTWTPASCGSSSPTTRSPPAWPTGRRPPPRYTRGRAGQVRRARVLRLRGRGHPAGLMAHPRLQLMDWKRRVLAMYAAVRAGGGDPAACAAFRAARDELFARAPAVPAARRGPGGLRRRALLRPPARLRVEAELEPDADGRRAGDPHEHRRADALHAASGACARRSPGREVSLAVYWLEGYGGGLFLPFRDALAGHGTYGGGRYLLDTVKGADLGERRRRAAGARLQLRLQPVLRLRPALELPAGAAGEPPRRGGRGRRADAGHG